MPGPRLSAALRSPLFWILAAYAVFRVVLIRVRFFDTDERRCTIYAARPGVCRAFPGSARCGYYDFLSFERRAQNDPEFVAATDHR